MLIVGKSGVSVGDFELLYRAGVESDDYFDAARLSEEYLSVSDYLETVR